MTARFKYARRRRGYSLVEALVVMTVGTALLAMAMSVLYLLKETQVQARQGLVDGRTVVRLADQFRDDVAAAVHDRTAAITGIDGGIGLDELSQDGAVIKPIKLSEAADMAY